MAEVKAITVYCREEEDGWWAESPSAPGFTAAAPSLDELEEQVQGGLRFLFGEGHPSAFLYILRGGQESSGGKGSGAASPADATKPTSGANTESKLVLTA